MDPAQLLPQPESEWLDFKKQYHDNNASLLHDILCLANAYTESDRFLVFGVTDDRQTPGVATDTNRRTDANLQDFLRAAGINRIPTCTLRSHDYNGAAIDVLEIRNRPDKPFFLTRDYESRGERVRNGVIYTRLGDTNIPKKESAPEDHVELMWRERFGLGLSPLDRAERLLGKVDDWIKVEGDSFLYHRQFPEFTIVDGKTMQESFVEPWTRLYPDPAAWSFVNSSLKTS